MCELLVGLPAVRVLGVVDEPDGPLFVHIETVGPRPTCRGCGVAATVKERDSIAPPETTAIACDRAQNDATERRP